MSRKLYMSLLFFCAIISEGYTTCDEDEDEIDPADDPKNIERPCSCPDDLECVKKYLEDHSNCKAVDEPPPEPWTIKKYQIKYTNVNTTLTLKNVQVYGLKPCKIIDFHNNHVTKKIVLIIETTKLRLVSAEGSMDYNRMAKASINRKDHVGCDYGVVIITIEIPYECENDINLNEMQVSVYATDGNPGYTLGPNFSKTSDPTAKNSFAVFIKNIPIAIQNEFASQAVPFGKLVMQNMFCNVTKKSRPLSHLRIKNNVAIMEK